MSSHHFCAMHACLSSFSTARCFSSLLSSSLLPPSVPHASVAGVTFSLRDIIFRDLNHPYAHTEPYGLEHTPTKTRHSKTQAQLCGDDVRWRWRGEDCHGRALHPGLLSGRAQHVPRRPLHKDNTGKLRYCSVGHGDRIGTSIFLFFLASAGLMHWCARIC